MHRDRYSPLPQAPLESLRCDIADVSAERRVRLDSSALEVMTDLRQVPAASVDAGMGQDEAHRAMQARGVRLLLVTDAARGVAGLVTAADFLGERPMRVAQERGLRIGEVGVAQVMTPLSAIEAVRLEDVLHAEVGHVIATLRRSGRQHALVIEPAGEGRARIRGIFSMTQIARQLGEPLPAATEIARSFAEIEAALAT
ncbi:CBS domain-containing protein [Thauera sinica]|uniref:CBS domain-containing protein n=1 Tax=Thauera sinica TaxID=2665146 RepID=A0ABW1ALC7_9RHOO|nr:CBS domain-containing protein [Thauera sp. K11]ATE60815.1 CBS domain-containing protein [Thauera sp. K11]